MAKSFGTAKLSEVELSIPGMGKLFAGLVVLLLLYVLAQPVANGVAGIIQPYVSMITPSGGNAAGTSGGWA